MAKAKRQAPPGAFKKGKPKTGGRKKGTPNKIPTEIKEKALYLLSLVEKGLEADIKKVTSSKRMDFYTEILEYAAPKQARVDSSGNAVTEVTLTVKRNRK